jgi:serine/threonine protein kinase
MKLKLNQYTWDVESQHPVGGSAHVWRVKRRTKRGIRRGLLKLKRPDVSSQQDYIDAFRREQRILSMLEDVAGEDLQERSERVSITVNESLEIMRGVLTGLRYLHQHNILHNDLKAANIVLRDDTGRPDIIDFGNSILLNEITPNSMLIFGAAPEQRRGIVDDKNDIYKLGEMWQHILGRDPWSKLDQSAGNLLSSMCHPDHNRRPTSKRALE